MSETRQHIARNITRLRLSADMTQKDLAEKLDYSDKAVSKWERAESTPDIDTLTRLADLFGVTLDSLVRDPNADAVPVTLEVPPIAPPIPPEEDGLAQKRRDINHGIITLISVLAVWFIAGLIYVLFLSIAPSLPHYWLVFVYAVPVSALLWLIFNAVWFVPRRGFLISSVLLWSILATVFFHLLCYGVCLWPLWLLGVPLQAAILLWSHLLFPKR